MKWVVKAATTKRGVVSADGKVERYGKMWPVGAPAVSVELTCYREAHGGGGWEGNLGAEEHFKRAWRLMWPKYEWSEWVELLVHAWCGYKWIMVLGHQRASKSFTMAHACFLDYCADPENTLASLGTVTFDGLKLRMWSDLQRAAETAAVKFPFTYRATTNELRIYPAEAQGEAAQKFQIHGMAMNNSRDAEGRVRGGHAPRRTLFLDEAENISDPIYEAMINPMSAPFARCVMLCNPMERVSKFGQWCEPRGGWSEVTPASLMWEGKATGSIVVHLDGLQSPNVRAGRVQWTGLLTPANVDEVLTKYGENSVQWWSLIRGWFPPDGLVCRCFPSATIEKARPAIGFDFRPGRCASLDPAFEHDQCVLHLAELGAVRRGERRLAVSGLESFEFKLRIGPEYEPKDYQIAHEVMRLCAAHGVRPEHFIMDRTGGGRGVFAILQKEWSRDVQGVDYGGKATARTLRGDDDRKCEDLYRFFVTELWMRAAEYCAEGLIGGLDRLHPNTLVDLNSRRYELKQGTNGMLVVVETKVEVKKRLGRSPDHGDAFVQFGELLERLGTRPGEKLALPGGTRWSAMRAKARELAAVHDEATAFSH